jgi:hypothetical protein
MCLLNDRNTGAWWNWNKIGENVYTTTFMRAIRNLLYRVKKMFRGRLVWRDIAPPDVGEAELLSSAVNGTLGWHQFDEWNRHARALVESAGHRVLRIDEVQYVVAFL